MGCDSIGPSEYNVHKALVALAMETVLFNIVKPVHDEVIGRLVSV
ncbi:hypothetical protein DYY67_0883 [Candidatus Nitrosotalea sp. TS]|nr:hypothetical protein [Candidatus Nitrosotalea sp. TS]NHI03813.1 hypothetical protein [Candidatus Nitrosotalea sp. TS]